MAYWELIKNFEKIRSYMREFYIYGFKHRSQYDAKSVRSYDDERRRIESYLGDYMGFSQTPEGKTVFLSVDSRTVRKNPFYRAWKAKSFTDRDITLHFLILDALNTPERRLTLTELLEEIDGKLAGALEFDESTLRKKLKEYIQEGILQSAREGRSVVYWRSPETDITGLQDVVDFFSEDAPCGVIGSYLQDRLGPHKEIFSFKHHDITSALDSDIMATLFEAMGEKHYITMENWGRQFKGKTLRLIPLRIYISAQNGRQYLMAYQAQTHRVIPYRLDYISNVQLQEVCPQFDLLRGRLNDMAENIWGVNSRQRPNQLEHVEFEIQVGPTETHILRRLEREKRCGTVQQLDETHYRFTAEVFDTQEMIPWIRSFICRLTRLNFSNRTVENQLKADIEKMYRMYGLEGGATCDFQ